MSTPVFDHVLTSLGELEALYPPTMPLAIAKKVDVLDEGARGIIAASRLVMVATTDARGRCTVSPRGGPAGFVHVLDEHRLALPDYGGNNLLDSLRNLLEVPAIGLLFVLTGRNETLRVNGSAWITTDPDVLSACVDDKGREPRSAVGVRVESVFTHCAQSFTRAGAWRPDTWAPDAAPSNHDVVVGHLRMTMAPEDLPTWAQP